MAMDFFAAQDKARKRTGRLVLYFVLALFLIIAVLYTVGMIIFNVGLDQQGGSHDLLNWPVLGVVTLFCVVVIGGGSLFKILQLSSGGSVVALSLGGRLIDRDGADADERRVLNVVEEMAIASGVPVPPVYLVEDDTINAFAAGYKPSDAVIGVTRGCVERLDRDQLQGVMAHEYSHIFNGDMRLNIRLVGVIHGLLVMGVIGYYVMRTAAFSGGARRSSNNKNGGGAGAILIVGLAMMAVGFIGTFFGRLIQSAVSRQREFLADASAVQYTRNPDGIAGALRVIGGLKKKSDMPSTASEYNHMFFTQAMHSIFASHPPVGERIARIEGIDAASLGPTPVPSTVSPGSGAAVSGFASDVPSTAVHEAVESIGQVNEASIRHVGHVLDSIPDSIRSSYTLGARSGNFGLPRTTMMLDVLFFAPPGAEIMSITPENGDIPSLSRSGVEKGNSAESRLVTVAQGETRTVSYTIRFGEGPLGALDLRHTPTVTDTPVSVDASCEALFSE